MAQPPIIFDRTTGTMTGANPWERVIGLALAAGSKVGAYIYHRGYNHAANLLKKLLPERDINVMLNSDAAFSFPYGDGYWSKLLNRTFAYEDELELLLLDSKDVDYTLIDCGANYGYWSVMVSSKRFGAHKAIAIEPSSLNYDRLAHNAKINGNRFETIRAAIGSKRGKARLSGTKHEQLSIVGAPEAGGEDVDVIALDDLVTDGKIAAQGKYLIKLDVEGVEIEAMKGGQRLAQTDTVFICEEHGNDPTHAVTRYIVEQTPMKAIIHDPVADHFEPVNDIAILDRIKTMSHVGYNVFGTSSAFWEERIYGLNSGAARRAMLQ
jgi:FkbM family methyltransferase